MKEKSREALERSIKKWENIVSGEGVDKGIENCALCQLHLTASGCGLCPLPKNCLDTPYDDWVNHFKTQHPRYKGERRVICHACILLAEKELDYLKSFRKEKKYYLKIYNPEVAIGDDTINILVVDENGKMINQGNLLRISNKGKLYRHIQFSSDTPIQLTHAERIQIDE